jgi:cell shape-determining protein MreC
MLLAAILIVSVVLAVLPEARTQPLRDAWREAMRPGEQVLATSGEWLQAAREKFRGTAGKPTGDAAAHVAELADKVRRLELELVLERSRLDASRLPPAANEVALAGYVTPVEPEPLVVSQAISARVLGRQAKAFLVERDVLDVGKSQAAQKNSLVVDADESLDSNNIVDQGGAANIKPNRLVLSGRRIWGRIADVGPHTSTVRRANDAGYRDLVQLASLQDGRLHFSARGMLVGVGQRLCKIELVETSQPVTIGDWVFTADDGVLDLPLLYGRVAKLERKPGAAHWEIWMEPAVAASAPPSRVSVLKIDLNPARTFQK